MTSRAVITVEPASSADLREVAELEKAAFSDPWSPASFRTLLSEPAVYFAVARDGDEGVGVAGYLVAWFAADEAEIANLAVREPGRRRGIGATLLDAAIAEAGRRGTAAMYLEVRESNEAARGLYASRDFEEVGRRPKYYRKPVEDAVVLRRSL